MLWGPKIGYALYPMAVIALNAIFLWNVLNFKYSLQSHSGCDWFISNTLWWCTESEWSNLYHSRDTSEPSVKCGLSKRNDPLDNSLEKLLYRYD